jgi:hypothetical protein
MFVSRRCPRYHACFLEQTRAMESARVSHAMQCKISTFAKSHCGQECAPHNSCGIKLGHI